MPGGRTPPELPASPAAPGGIPTGVPEHQLLIPLRHRGGDDRGLALEGDARARHLDSIFGKDRDVLVLDVPATAQVHRERSARAPLALVFSSRSSLLRFLSVQERLMVRGPFPQHCRPARGTLRRLAWHTGLVNHLCAALEADAVPARTAAASIGFSHDALLDVFLNESRLTRYAHPPRGCRSIQAENPCSEARPSFALLSTRIVIVTRSAEALMTCWSPGRRGE